MNRIVRRMGGFTLAGTVLLVALAGSPASAAVAVGQPHASSPTAATAISPSTRLFAQTGRFYYWYKGGNFISFPIAGGSMTRALDGTWSGDVLLKNGPTHTGYTLRISNASLTPSGVSGTFQFLPTGSTSYWAQGPGSLTGSVDRSGSLVSSGNLALPSASPSDNTPYTFTIQNLTLLPANRPTGAATP